MMKNKVFRLIWVMLVAISAFTLGYTLKPASSRRPPSLDMNAMMGNGQFQMPSGQSMPPANFSGR